MSDFSGEKLDAIEEAIAAAIAEDAIAARFAASDESEARWAYAWCAGIYPSPDIANAEDLRRAYVRGWMDRRKRGHDLSGPEASRDGS